MYTDGIKIINGIGNHMNNIISSVADCLMGGSARNNIGNKC